MLAFSFGCVGTSTFPVKGLGLAKCEVNKSYVENVPYQKVVSYTENVPYTQEEYFVEKEPYNATVTQEQQCSYTTYIERECTDERVSYLTYYKCFYGGWQDNWTYVECTVENNDSIGGSFVVYYGISSDKNALLSPGNWGMTTEIGVVNNTYISSHSSKTFYYDQQMRVKNCYCDATSLSTKPVCSDVEKTMRECQNVSSGNANYGMTIDVGKNHTVTLYRNETKSRNFTDYRMETRYALVEEAC